MGVFRFSNKNNSILSKLRLLVTRMNFLNCLFYRRQGEKKDNVGVVVFTCTPLLLVRDFQSMLPLVTLNLGVDLQADGG